jgi:hypothetical protein
LDEAFAELKHMIVLSDGVSHPGDFDALAEQMKRAGITISTVAVGEQSARELLEYMAERGGGHYYYCDDPAAIPQIFALETATASKMGIIEQPFSPQIVSRTAALAELGLEDAPSLLGYIETKPKPTSRLVLASEAGDPLLIWWRYGLGISVAFTSDIQSRWATAWLGWPGFGRFWSRLVRHAMRKDEAKDFVLRVEHSAGAAKMDLEAIDPEGRFLNASDVTITVIGPDGGAHQLPVPQVAPGCYRTTFGTPGPGAYSMEVRLEHQGRLVYVQRRAVVVDYPDEYRTRPTNDSLLKKIAEGTGGVYDPDPAALLAPPAQTVPRTTLLWPYCLIAAAVIFTIDVAVRRIVRRQ